MHPISLTRSDALIIVDVQNDFLPGGSLAVSAGDEVIEIANRLIALYSEHDLPVFASRCWHPPEHVSFAARGGPWPPHCVAHTQGAAFPDALALTASTAIISKGTERDVDAYSAFQGTGLAEQLRAHGSKRLAICGIATDYCVLNTVTDALELGFEVLLVQDGVRAVDVQPGDGDRAVAVMAERGAVPVQTVAAAEFGAVLLIEAERRE